MRHLLFPFVLFILCTGCSEPASEPRQREGGGGRYYGGVFNANESEIIRSLFPLSLTQAAAHRIGTQIYEGLVRFDQQDLSIQPSLAERWEMDASGTVYTFHLRKGVRFHDDPCFKGGQGRELTADDVLYCLTAVCTFSEANQMDWLLRDRIQGANSHYAASAAGKPSDGVKGLVKVDDHTIRIHLNSAWPGLLQVLAHQGCWVYPPELPAHYGEEVRWHPVGTGAFAVRQFQAGQAMIMERNPHYWGEDEHGNRLPFLDAVRITFVADKEVELAEFQKKRLSILHELPVDRPDLLQAAEVGSGYVVQTMPGLTVQFYGFNRSMAPFQDVRVRKAFSLAIDRRYLVDSVLNGLAVAAQRGVVAPGFNDYPYEVVPELTHDPATARTLLAEAGFPRGEGLPTVFLHVNNSGVGYVQVAGEVQGMLERELGAKVVTTVLPSDQHFARVERGEAPLWREGWVVDHPDPENFLTLFYGPNAPMDASAPAYLNSTRYRDARFDSLYAAAQRTTEPGARMQLLAQAERRLMEDAAVIPLYHERNVRLLQPWVMDLPINGMEYRDLRAVWFDPQRRR